MKTTTKAWVAGGSIIAAFFAITFGAAFFAPLPEKPPVIIVDVKNETEIINETKPIPPQPDPIKPDIIPKPHDDDPKIIINDTGVFIFNFSENSVLKK